MDFTLLQAAKKVQCGKHQEPISFICIADKCQSDRLYCNECFDGDSPGEHIMISIKKFSQLYQKFKNLGGSNTQKKIRKQIFDFRKNINTMIDQIEKKALTSTISEVLLANGQQQQIRGKMISIVNNPIWRRAHQYKKDNRTQAQIEQMIKESQHKGTQHLFKMLQIIIKSVQNKLNDGVQTLSLKSQVSKASHYFSKQLKHPKIQYLQGRTVAKGASDPGPFFALTEDILTVQKPTRDFIIRSYGLQDAASLWIGVTSADAAEINNFANIHQQGKSSDFMVLFNGGKSINTWSHFCANPVKSQTDKNCHVETRARVQVDHNLHTIKLYLGTDQNHMALFDQHRARTTQGLHAAVGFSGQGEIQYV